MCPVLGAFFIRTITTVTVQNLHDSDDLDLLAAGVTERVELESRVLVLRADAGVSDDHQNVPWPYVDSLTIFLAARPKKLVTAGGLRATCAQVAMRKECDAGGE
jgi:hypothetical protein